MLQRLSIVCTTIIAFLFLSGFQKDPGIFAFQFFIEDSVSIDVFELRNPDQTLKGYYARVFTPICEDWECYDVELDFYWDILGSFYKFDTIPGNPLTKKEHDPFTKTDYIKLNGILMNPQPSLASLHKDEIVRKVVVDSLDGISGATIASIKDEIVPGAALSCYTLWHIAHGFVVDSMQNYTKRNLDQKTVEFLASSENDAASFFLIDCLDPEDFQMYFSSIRELMQKHQGYFSRYTIERMPASLFEEVEAQSFFSKIAPGLGYFGQFSLLKRLKKIAISDSLALATIQLLDNRDASLNQEIIELIITNSNELEYHTIKEFLRSIYDKDVPMTKAQYERLVPLIRMTGLKTEGKKLKKRYGKSQKR